MAVVCWLIDIYGLILIARIVLEWLQLPFDHPVTRVRAVLRAVTDPVLVPIRRVVPPLRAGGVALDLSPLVVFAILIVLRAIIC